MNNTLSKLIVVHNSRSVEIGKFAELLGNVSSRLVCYRGSG